MKTLSAKEVPIHEIAKALGLEVSGRKCRCFNLSAHKNHSDNHPSLTMHEKSNRFCCFACGIKGDGIDLVKAVEKVEFKEAIDWLNKTFGCTWQPALAAKASVPKLQPKFPDEESRKIYMFLESMCYEIDADCRAGEYLLTRGIDLDVAFNHGAAAFDDPRRVWEVLNEKFSREALKKAGLVTNNNEFLFHFHRLLFFYMFRDERVYIQGRDVTGNSSVKELSLTGLVSPVPFNVDSLASNLGTTLVVEGCIDTLSAIMLGEGAVGIPGVTAFREEWFQYFRKTALVTVVFDNDRPGITAAKELSTNFRKHRIKSNWKIPTVGKDVNDFLVSKLKEKNHE